MIPGEKPLKRSLQKSKWKVRYKRAHNKGLKKNYYHIVMAVQNPAGPLFLAGPTSLGGLVMQIGQF